MLHEFRLASFNYFIYSIFLYFFFTYLNHFSKCLKSINEIREFFLKSKRLTRMGKLTYYFKNILEKIWFSEFEVAPFEFKVLLSLFSFNVFSFFGSSKSDEKWWDGLLLPEANPIKYGLIHCKKKTKHETHRRYFIKL